ncbi:inorganic pyrophosphatase [Sphingobacterium allocomposti]|jgi:inorganic pyrophosphatase|uniref:Inorganic pyrophosphatase n=1 Tax=Sphingobacterium allocomposti TaxID=415956 RepID=A0A5S5DKG9_9SPHI|nr:inorganic diphosphatase [Sphingobacterium composti Yoo et al. 2007 non Ten et al. 2007]TYP96104.1 inorganic pyrophosphatase [Sphingobacterium composti Yoo et al. 2007 non Ten et al. 2007]HLS96201.1 inorganic diphosphatase [Sphingobacterium sp.]
MSKQHPWHQVAPGSDVPNTVNAIIEITNGSKGKYELDKETGLLLLDRVLSSSVVYPANYGFIPQTYCDDKDPLDILVICSVDILPMTLVEAKVIGVMHMVDGGEQDDKIIAVAKNDPTYNHINDIEQLAPHIMKEVVQFFESYKALEKKSVVVNGTFGRERAQEIILESIELYKNEFGNK